MGSDDSHTRPKPVDNLRVRVRKYAVRVAKASLCMGCWAGIVAMLLIYGPPAMSVSTASGSLRASEVVDAGFGILLSAGTATFLTIILVGGALAFIDRRHSQSADRHQHEATDSTEDETMPDQSPSDESDGERQGENNTDQILNPETRRVLREWGRRGYAVGAGVLAALVMLIPTTVTAACSPGIAFHLAVTLVFSLMLPVVAVCVGVRVYGLSHQEVVYAAREGIGATTTLDKHQRVEQPPEQPAEPIDTDPSAFTESDTDDTQ